MAADAVAVTGSSGFLGRHLAAALAEDGREVVEVGGSSGVDVRSFAGLEGLPPFGLMVHLAAKSFVPESYERPLDFYLTNVTGTIHCLELCRRRSAGIIFLSSYVYGPPRYLPVDESHPVAHWNPYASSKIMAEEACRAYALHHGVAACVLRTFNMYGPGQDGRFLVPTILAGLRRGSLALQTPHPRRDFVYVGDVADAVVRCARGGLSGFTVYNVGSGKSHSVAEVVGRARELLGSDAPVRYGGACREADIEETVADISRINGELGWSPSTGLTEGLRLTIKG